MRARLFGSCVVIISMMTLHTPWAHADVTPEEQALATTLFKEAKALLEDGKVAEACPKLAESQRLYPAGGTLLNLASCHEREGKTATAAAEYREARLIADRDHRDDRVLFIDDRLKELEPKLSKLTISIAPKADVPNVEVMVDGRVLRRPAWGTAMPVDPGEHLIEATAPGKRPWRAQVTVLPDADIKMIGILEWQDDHAAPAPTPTAEAPITQAPEGTSRSRNRTPALIAGIAGLGGVMIGSYFGLRAISKHNQSDDACTANPCSETSQGFNNDAKTAADVATVSFAVGIVGLGVGAYLWFFTGDTTKPGRSSTRFTPSFGPGRGSLGLTRTF